VIAKRLDDLGRGRFRRLTAATGRSELDIIVVRDFIRSHLHPYPVFADPASGSGNRVRVVPYVRPVLLVLDGSCGRSNLDIVVVEQSDLALGVSPAYRALASSPAASDDRRHTRTHLDRADFLLSLLEQRWQTMRMVGEHAVRRQEAFIRGGAAFPRPLTRAQVARELQLPESTVSRAVANRNVQLPSSVVIPMSNLFRGSLRLHNEIRQVIAGERFPMSDDQIDAALALRGHRVRRTVAKHRDALGNQDHEERQRVQRNGPRIGIGDISFQGGGPIPPHRSHQTGLDVDVRPVRAAGVEGPVRLDLPGYLRALTQQLVDAIRSSGAPVQFILFNDPAVRGVRPARGHDNHLHIRFSAGPVVPAGSRPAVAAPAASTTTMPTRQPTTMPTPRQPTISAVTPATARLGTLVSARPTGSRYPTFHQFIRAYSAALQPVLRSWRAARRHMNDPDFARTGRDYPTTGRNPAPPGIPVGQLRRFLRLQETPWEQLPPGGQDARDRRADRPGGQTHRRSQRVRQRAHLGFAVLPSTLVAIVHSVSGDDSKAARAVRPLNATPPDVGDPLFP
jgi:hypothetical protein